MALIKNVFAFIYFYLSKTIINKQILSAINRALETLPGGILFICVFVLLFFRFQFGFAQQQLVECWMNSSHKKEFYYWEGIQKKIAQTSKYTNLNRPTKKIHLVENTERRDQLKNDWKQQSKQFHTRSRKEYVSENQQTQIQQGDK